MDFFGSKKKQPSSVVWRDASGNIRCLGDDCPQKACDDTCPIWLSTMAASMSAIGEIQHALSLLEKASKIAPDFYDAWNNMGAMHGQLGNYQQAHDCYLKAHKIKPEKFQPLFGLAMSSRDLKQYDECLRWCDEYDKLFSDHRCDDVRAAANNALKRGAAPGNDSSSQHGFSPVTICSWLLEEGKKAGFVRDDKAFPNIPEIMSQARPVVLQILTEMKKASPNNFLSLTPCWAAYAAMGAVRFWYDDWDTLKKIGIYQSLTAPRGFDEMDEFVSDYIGWKFGSKKSEDFVQHIRLLGITTLARISKENHDDSNTMAAYVSMLMAFFYYGMIIEMNELGMR